jgi:hypothetical protein
MLLGWGGYFFPLHGAAATAGGIGTLIAASR